MKIVSDDPRLELPLTKDFEDLIERIGARAYLVGMVKEMGVQFSVPVEILSDAECHKACRAVIRSCRDYDGKELCQ